MILMPGLKCKYDAWNRIVEVRNTNNELIATYEYNGLNQRIKKTVGKTETKSFFNENWQELESQTNSGVTSYVWGLRYIDDLVLREKAKERLYSIADSNWNVVALVDVNGNVQERYTYDAFGKRNIFDANFTAKTETSFDWNRAFTGQVLDGDTGLMLYRMRCYHTGLGRFVSRDPIGYEAGDMNLLRYVFNTPIRKKDILGTNIYVETGNTGWNPLNRMVHQNICVELWENCDSPCPKNKGKKCFSFAASIPDGWSVSKDWGMIYNPQPVPNASMTRKKVTTCEEDKYYLDVLNSMLDDDNTNTGSYNLFGNNCRTFCNNMFDDAPGIEYERVCIRYERRTVYNTGGIYICVESEWREKK
jgi:RHS repeat-associated protein